MLAALHVHYAGIDGDFGNNEWIVMEHLCLLTNKEINIIKTYGGFKPFLCIKWALAEVRMVLLRADGLQLAGGRLELSMRDAQIYHNFVDNAFRFRGHASQVSNLLAAPVPFPYFHVVKLMLVVTLTLVGWALVTLLEGSPGFIMICFCLFALIEIGLQEISAAMSDPFGDDDIDFDTEGLLASAYNNAIAYLREGKEICGSALPPGIENPLDPMRLEDRKWSKPAHLNKKEAGAFNRRLSAGIHLCGGDSGSAAGRLVGARPSVQGTRSEEFDA